MWSQIPLHSLYQVAPENSGGKDIFSDERASTKERLLIVPFLGLYQTSHFQLVGPNLISSPFEPCQGVWFLAGLGSPGAETDEYSNDSCQGPHSPQHICGRTKRVEFHNLEAPADSMAWLQPTSEHIGF